MGDKTIWYEDCPQCQGKGTVEVVDASSSLIFSRRCEKCGWTDGLGYYDSPTGDDRFSELILCTEEKALELGLIMRCPVCKEMMTWWENRTGGCCRSCECNRHYSEEEGDSIK
jgi:hypothetical protein